MLFHRFELRALFEEQDNKLTRSVESVPASEILSKSPDQLAEKLFDAFRVDPPVLRESDIQASQEEAQVDVSQDPMRFIRERSRPFYLPGTRVSAVERRFGVRERYRLVDDLDLARHHRGLIVSRSRRSYRAGAAYRGSVLRHHARVRRTAHRLLRRVPCNLRELTIDRVR